MCAYNYACNGLGGVVYSEETSVGEQLLYVPKSLPHCFFFSGIARVSGYFVVRSGFNFSTSNGFHDYPCSLSDGRR